MHSSMRRFYKHDGMQTKEGVRVVVFERCTRGGEAVAEEARFEPFRFRVSSFVFLGCVVQSIEIATRRRAAQAWADLYTWSGYYL